MNESAHAFGYALGTIFVVLFQLSFVWFVVCWAINAVTALPLFVCFRLLGRR